MYFKRQKFLVAGMSKSGEGSARFLLERGAEVYVYDDVSTQKVNEIIVTLEGLGAVKVTNQTLERVIETCDILILSPGIPIDNKLPIAFRKRCKAIIGEEELASLFLRSTAIAVTGTNGKTTTVTMINDILTACGKQSYMCGNCGRPLINLVNQLTFDEYTVIEISSFQLETLFSLRPHIAVITNITEDHLNRHYNMENYIYLKGKLLQNLRESEYAILNYDDERVVALAERTKGKVVYFSVKQQVEGAYVLNGCIYFNGEKYMDCSQLSVGGVHNIYNALASVAVSAILGLDKEDVCHALTNFKGVKHRIEFIGRVAGVDYINDSKATNVDATIHAISAMTKPTIVLLGGKDKGEDYSPLFSHIAQSKVIHAIIYGENAFKILSGATNVGYKNISLCQNLQIAVKLADILAKGGQCVLLSPASASFDCFNGYEERGEAFIDYVKQFNNFKSCNEIMDNIAVNINKNNNKQLCIVEDNDNCTKNIVIERIDNGE